MDSYAYKDGNPNESIEGTVETDLIFGEAGDDYIYAYNGNDIIYGGEGDDRIYGGYGEDILNGGAGNNILIGGSEYDTYKINSQDKGQNTIQDDNGDGHVKLDGAVLGGGTNANTVSTIYYTDGVNTYEWDGHNGDDLIINGTTRVEDFYNTKLGINLTDEKGGNNDKPPTDSTPPGSPPGGGGGTGGGSGEVQAMMIMTHVRMGLIQMMDLMEPVTASIVARICLFQQVRVRLFLTLMEMELKPHN